MLDLSLALRELQQTQEVHIISVNNECKELLLILGQTVPQEIKIHCVNLSTKGEQEGQHFTFTREQEQCSQCNYTDSLDEYLYEPNTCLALFSKSPSSSATSGSQSEIAIALPPCSLRRAGSRKIQSTGDIAFK